MAQQICSSCGKKGIPTPQTKGSCLVELVLWFFFIVPGIIYSVWRRSKVPMVCPSCNKETMIPLDSPTAKKMVAESTEPSPVTQKGEITVDAETKKCPACAEAIKLEAIKCRFCGEEFDSEEVAKQVEARKAEIDEELRLAKEREGKTQCPQCDNCKKSLKAMGVA